MNGLNTPIKIQRLSDWFKTQDPSIYYLQETQLSNK